MITKLTTVGDNQAVIIDRQLLTLLDIIEDTALEVKTDGQTVLIRPVMLDRKARLRESTARMMATHAETLRELAK